MVDVTTEIEVLRKQGLEVRVIAGPEGLRYCVGDFQLKTEHLLTLHRNGKLNITGIRELHEQMQREELRVKGE
jgi:hypothetical protein